MTEQNSLYDRVFSSIKERRNRVLSGKINCIPWNLPRFEEENPGIEQGKYYLLSANSKVGKYKFDIRLFTYRCFAQLNSNI